MLHRDSGRNDFGLPVAPPLPVPLRVTMCRISSGRNDFEVARIAEQVHTGITCDQCGMSPIRGIRYRCSVCADYDLCGNCVQNPIESGRHESTHYFLRIPRTDFRVQATPSVMNRLAYVHTGYTCDVCSVSPIVGYRYQCAQCQHDICEACESLGRHDPTHPRLKYLVPRQPASK
jgi:hypothetical protein